MRITYSPSLCALHIRLAYALRICEQPKSLAYAPIICALHIRLAYPPRL
jgi:hypothetical protein